MREPLTFTIGKSFCVAHVGNVERTMLAYPGKPRVVNIYHGAFSRYGYRPRMSPHNHCFPFAESERYIINPTNPRGACHNLVKHRLHIRGRAADDTEHLGGRGLVFQRLAQFRVAFLDFFEQPHVLDRDDRLRGEGFKQCDLLVGKRPDLGAANINHTDGVPSRSSGVTRIVERVAAEGYLRKLLSSPGCLEYAPSCGQERPCRRNPPKGSALDRIQVDGP